MGSTHRDAGVVAGHVRGRELGLPSRVPPGSPDSNRYIAQVHARSERLAVLFLGADGTTEILTDAGVPIPGLLRGNHFKIAMELNEVQLRVWLNGALVADLAGARLRVATGNPNLDINGLSGSGGSFVIHDARFYDLTPTK